MKKSLMQTKPHLKKKMVPKNRGESRSCQIKKKKRQNLAFYEVQIKISLPFGGWKNQLDQPTQTLKSCLYFINTTLAPRIFTTRLEIVLLRLAEELVS
jgi:hypothetical protein